MRKVHVKSYGCQMNVYDSARMTDLLRPHGYVPTDVMDEADLVILNTCHIREKATEKVFSELGRLRHMRDSRLRHMQDSRLRHMQDSRGQKAPDAAPMMIAVAGCVAQAEGEEVMRRAPFVDMVLGPQTYHRLPEMIARAEIARAEGGTRGIIETDFPVEDKFDTLAGVARTQGVTAFLTVQEGCDKFCTFCVVPYTRGAEYSRPLEAIEDEARALVEQGVREITLLGQNVSAWSGGSYNGHEGLGGLIRALARIEGIKRLRYTTSYPAEIDDALIAVHGDEEKLMPFLHLPVQSGSDRILAAMNRRHDRAAYLRLVKKLRAARPDIALSSDFIVGFPGETEADFDRTLSLIEEVHFAGAFSFAYSPRPGTPASVMTGQVADGVKSERLQRLQGKLLAQQEAFNMAGVGTMMEVLLEKPGRHGGQLVGRSPYMQAVYVDNTHQAAIGDMVSLRIESATTNSLKGVFPLPAFAPVADAYDGISL